MTKPAHPVLCCQAGCWGLLRSVPKYVIGVWCSGVNAVDSGCQNLGEWPGFCPVQEDGKDYAVVDPEFGIARDGLVSPQWLPESFDDAGNQRASPVDLWC